MYEHDSTLAEVNNDDGSEKIHFSKKLKNTKDQYIIFT